MVPGLLFLVGHPLHSSDDLWDLLDISINPIL